MRLILFRLIAILEVAGGFYGMAGWLPRLLAFGPLRTAAIGLIAFALYAFVLVAGVLLLENSERGIRLSSIAQLLQWPLIATPMLSYAMHCGAYIDVFAALHWPTRPELSWQLGSQRFMLEFYGSSVSRLGVNLLALLSWVVLRFR
jgi:hypothetical protein